MAKEPGRRFERERTAVGCDVERGKGIEAAESGCCKKRGREGGEERRRGEEKPLLALTLLALLSLLLLVLLLPELPLLALLALLKLLLLLLLPLLLLPLLALLASLLPVSLQAGPPLSMLLEALQLLGTKLALVVLLQEARSLQTRKALHSQEHLEWRGHHSISRDLPHDADRLGCCAAWLSMRGHTKSGRRVIRHFSKPRRQGDFLLQGKRGALQCSHQLDLTVRKDNLYGGLFYPGRPG